jgi:hemerythrin superfamily protein
MATTLTTKAQRAEERRKAAQSAALSKHAEAGEDAIALLTADHAEVARWFDEYEEATSDKDKAALCAKICLALTVHTQIEEELFYPQSREATKDEDIINEALVEHASVKNLIEQIRNMKVGDELYDAKVNVLGEYVRHHVKEEEEELFPEVRSTNLDLQEIGAKLAARKDELMKELSPKQKH